jgi:hypothetical protein
MARLAQTDDYLFSGAMLSGALFQDAMFSDATPRRMVPEKSWAGLAEGSHPPMAN